MVYILNIDGHTLMPTTRHGKVRRLLKENKAKVIRRCPFTIQLLYETTDFKQDINLGVDAGSRHVGLSATTVKAVLYLAEVELRTDIVKLLASRREIRRGRRSRIRYRQPRFNNRKRRNGWLAPSVQNKIDTHLKTISDVFKILPITKIIVEVADFDIQKLKADLVGQKRPIGKEYQQGEQMGFWNVREYVLWRDGHKCRNCGVKNIPLEVHHIESRQTGGDSPGNLVTLCENCHDGHHKGTVQLKPSIQRTQSFRDASFMNVVRKYVYDELKRTYPNVEYTYGYITKNIRIKNKMEKSHINDAICISGNPIAKPIDECFYIKKVRCHNRQIHKAKILKGGTKKRNQSDYEVKGFRLFDKVMLNNKVGFIFGRRSSGYFDIRTLDGKTIHAGVSYKKLQLLEKAKSNLTERR